MRRQSLTLVSTVLALIGLSGCRISTSVQSSGDLTQDEWNTYYSVAVRAINDPLVWKTHVGERPMEFVLHSMLKPWGSRPRKEVGAAKAETSENLVYVHIPVDDIGKQGQGVPHVDIVFRHPSREIVAIYATHIVF